MIDIVQSKSGKQNIIFIVDEVGQYVASRDNLILNLDGLAKNLKRLGDGKAWIISTAQQTLTEDDPRAALNSDSISSRIDSQFRSIWNPVILRKSATDACLQNHPAERGQLGKLFDAHGRTSTEHEASRCKIL